MSVPEFLLAWCGLAVLLAALWAAAMWGRA
jgi:hypothetical protein